MLKGYRCVKTDQMNQEFGENNACYRVSDGRVIGKSTAGRCPNGYVLFYTEKLNMKGHNGTDWGSIKGEKVYHAWNYDGYIKNHIDSAGGNGVDVISKEQVELADGRKAFVKVRYWHNLQNLLADGTEVSMGDAIALADSTGASSGHHVHEGLKEVEKMAIEELAPEDRYHTINKGNGYYGAIDPRPYQENKFVLEVPKDTEIDQKKKEELETVIIQLKRIVAALIALVARLRSKG
jgi:hypothetical protein